MADDIRVRLSPEGVEDVLAALKKVRAGAGSAAKGAAKEVGVLKQAMEEIKELAPTIGLAAVILGVISLGKHALETGEHIRKMGQAVGATAEDLSVFRFASITADVSMEQLEKGMVKLARNVVELRNGNEKATDSFDQLGLSAADFAGKDTGQAFALVAERLGKLPDGIEKSALAFDLLGKGGAKLIPLMNDIATKGFAAVRKEAEDAGLIMSTQFVKAAEEANDQMKLAKAQAEGLAIAFTTGLAPGIAEAVDEFRKGVKSGDTSGLKELGEAVGHFAVYVVRAFLIAGQTVAAFMALMTEKAKDLKKLGSEISSGFHKGNAIAGPIGGLIGIGKAITTPTDSKQVEIIDELGKKIDEILTKTEPSKLGAHKAALDALLSGDEEGEKRSIGLKDQIARLTGKLRDDDLKSLSDVAAKTEATNERIILAERALADARAAKNAITLEGQKAIDAAEQNVFRARVENARETANRELAIVKLRTDGLLALANKDFAGTKERAGVVREIHKQEAEATLAINVKLFQDLTRLRESYLADARSAASTIIALDKEIAKNKREQQRFAEEITLAGLSDEQKLGYTILLANQRTAELRDAALSGDLEKTRELRTEVIGLARDIAKMGEARVAENIFGEANDLFQLAANARQLQAKTAGDVATKEADKLKTELATVKDQIGEAANAIVANIKPKVDTDALNTLIADVQKTLGSQKFTIQLYPQMVGGPAVQGQAGYASGGPIRGWSPHSRADNIPIFATADEFMQPVRAVRHYGTDFMESIRTLQFPRFADGGQVGGGWMDGAGAMQKRVVEFRAGGASASGEFTDEQLRSLTRVLREMELGDGSPA
jgi:hypothetical protein